MQKWWVLLGMAAAFLGGLGLQGGARSQNSAAMGLVMMDPTPDLGTWEGWGSSLAWWGRAVGGTANADYYADLLYTTKSVDGYPGLGLNIVRYNGGGGGA